MRTKGTLWILMLVGATAAAAAGKANPGFDMLKTLLGEWEGKTPDGHAVTATYKLVSGGTALMEQMSVGDMLTVYHPDGDSVMLTHYCEGNNQPRMRATGLSRDGRTLDFRFVDVTNQANSSDDIMRNVKITFQDADHITQEWVSSKDGKDTPMVISYARRK